MAFWKSDSSGAKSTISLNVLAFLQQPCVRTASILIWVERGCKCVIEKFLNPSANSVDRCCPFRLSIGSYQLFDIRRNIKPSLVLSLFWVDFLNIVFGWEWAKLPPPPTLTFVLEQLEANLCTA